MNTLTEVSLPRSKQSIITIPLSQIEQTFDVRENHTEPDNVSRLRGKKKNGEILDPIVVQVIAPGRYEVIDGRNRIKAAEEDGEKSISAVIVDFGTNGEKLLHAFRLNDGKGALPPKRADYVRLIVRMLTEEGWGESRLFEAYPTLKYWRAEAKRVINTMRCENAFRAMQRGDVTLHEAAMQNKLTDADLQVYIGTKNTPSTLVEESISKLDYQFDSVMKGFIQGRFVRLTTAQGRGDVSKAEYLNFISRLMGHLNKAIKNAERQKTTVQGRLK